MSDTATWTSERYIDERLDPQQKWHSSKSSSAQKCYKRLQLAQHICIALVPIIAIIPVTSPLEWIKSLITALAGILAGIFNFINKQGNYHNLWIQYRIVSEELKYQKYLYLTHTFPYDAENRLNQLVSKSEETILNLNCSWEKSTRELITEHSVKNESTNDS